MSLDRAIEHGREHRRQYHDSRAFDYTCRNHGGKGKRHDGWQCPACKANRLIQLTKEQDRIQAQLKEINGN